MPRKKRHYELPDEVIAVLDCSSNLEPCEEFRHADIYAFAKHLKEEKCRQCLEFHWQADKELKTMRLLSAWRKSRNN